MLLALCICTATELASIVIYFRYGTIVSCATDKLFTKEIGGNYKIP
jgi:hypothetical protein